MKCELLFVGYCKMNESKQLSFFEESDLPSTDLKRSRSGTFVDNMTLPVHRWFRYSAGFSAEWVEQLLVEWKTDSRRLVLDPFAGSGTVPLTCEQLSVPSIAIEAHPVVARICQAKLYWATSIDQFADFSEQVTQTTRKPQLPSAEYPDLIQRSFDPELLAYLDGLKRAWYMHNDDSPASELVWLAITAILRSCSSAGTAQWQYILPNKTKKKVLHPNIAFRQQIEMMLFDMRWMQSRAKHSLASMVVGDARKCSESISRRVDAVITSPPYANNYDYADALRFEMTFWGEVNNWGDIHEKVRRHLIVSSSQHSSKDRVDLDEVLALAILEPIHVELAEVVKKLAVTREHHGGKKHYHTMVAAYCRDIAEVLRELRTLCRSGAQMWWVIGGSAP